MPGKSHLAELWAQERRATGRARLFGIMVLKSKCRDNNWRATLNKDANSYVLEILLYSVGIGNTTLNADPLSHQGRTHNKVKHRSQAKLMPKSS